MRRARIIANGMFALLLAACNPTEQQTPNPSDASTPTAMPQPVPSDEAAPTEPPDARWQPGDARIAPEPDPAVCGADRLADYLNLPPTSDAMDKIRAAIGHDRIRPIRPGYAVTMDFRPDRLNIEIAADGRMKVFRCG